ncbi:MAG TPA: hypothetical protein VLH16_01945 [Bacteroidales bacterium]|nr:hypothetical protein [Bacteroidales bacterium]
MKIRILCSFACVLSLIPLISFAQIQLQDNNQKNDWLTAGWTLKANIGAMQFHGDIAEKSFLGKLAGETQFGYSFAVRKDLSTLLFAEARIQNGNLYSAKEFLLDNTLADMHFNANVFEHTFLVGINLTNLIGGTIENQHYHIYGATGIGVLHWNSTLYQTSTRNVLGTMGFGQGNGLWQRASAISVPLGFGIDYHLFNNLWINFETSLITVNSDWLDVRTGASNFDMYSFTGIGVLYKFGTATVTQRGTRQAEPRHASHTRRNIADYPSLLDFPGFTLPVREEPVQTEITVVQDENAANRRELTPFQPADPISGGGYMPQFAAATEVQQMPGTIPPPDGVFFSVQIRATRQNTDIRPWITKYQLEYPVIVSTGNGWMRFSTGAFETHENAIAYQQVLRARGISDAFVIAISNGQRVPLSALKGR